MIKRNLINRINKGDIFWYKYNKTIYSGIVLDVQSEYYLIALSEPISDIPKNNSDVLEAELYTVAWFSEFDLISKRRMHIYDHILIEEDFNFRAGFANYTEKGITRKLQIKNCGQPATWKHEFCLISFNQVNILDVTDPNRLPLTR